MASNQEYDIEQIFSNMNRHRRLPARWTAKAKQHVDTLRRMTRRNKAAESRVFSRHSDLSRRSEHLRKPMDAT